MSDKHPSPTTTTTTLNEVDKTRTPPTPIVAVHEPPMPPSSPPPPRPSPHSSIDSSPSSNVATGEHSMTSTGQPHLDPTSTTTTTTTTGTEKTPSRQPSSRTLNAQQRRSLITKFATIHTDKYPENLRREFPMSNFDRNLTVEKARFEPQPLNHDTNNTTLHHHHHPHHHHPKEGGYSGVATPATTTTSSSPPHDHLQAASSSHHRPTTASSPTSYTTNNSITPSASSTTGLHTASSTYSVNGNGTGATSTSTAPCGGGGNTTPAGGAGGGNGPVKPIMQPTKSRSEGDRTCRTNKKRRRPPPPVSGTATPAEVFHRNLIDAVSNVEDSDENEHYVYSYGGATTIDPTSYHSDLGYHRPQSIRSSPPSSHHPENKWLAPWSSTASFFSDLFRINSNHSQRPPIATRSSSLTTHGIADDEAEAAYQPHHRPKLRNYVIPKQHPYADPWATAAGGGDHHHWYDSKRNMIGSAATTTPSHHLPPPPPQPSRHRRRIYPWAYHTDGYSSDDEDTPLMMGRSLRSSKRSRKKKRLCSRVFRNTMLAFLFLVLATCFLVLYRAKPLVDIGVEMGRVLASDKELIFDLRVKANNWNWWTVRVADADISMFAFSQVVPLSNNTVIHGVDPAEYLGSFYRFDEPLAFPPAMLSREQVEASSQIRIKSPGADKSGNERWSRIIRYPYGLVARGVLKYRPLPFTGAYSQSVAICDVARVEPISGVISEDPDQSYCLKHAKGIDQ